MGYLLEISKLILRTLINDRLWDIYSRFALYVSENNTVLIHLVNSSGRYTMTDDLLLGFLLDVARGVTILVAELPFDFKQGISKFSPKISHH